MNTPAIANHLELTAVEREIDRLILDEPVMTGTIQRDMSPFWAALAATGTIPWLDSGDLDAVHELWDPHFAAVTTNNSLLNNEVQSGAYDEIIDTATGVVEALDSTERVREVGLLINCLHARRLVELCGGQVSIELHTSLADDVLRTVHYARRIHSLDPERFIIKVPFTSAGLIACRKLERLGVPVNLTLGFSARQNLVAAAFARPQFVNVFLGRLGAFVADNDLGTPAGVGEKATLSSQQVVRMVRKRLGTATQQIAASLREPDQVASLAGVDVHTMPATVARLAPTAIMPEQLHDRTGDRISVEVADEIAESIAVLWQVASPVADLVDRFEAQPPVDDEELRYRCHEAGTGDLFPVWSEEDQARILRDGKIPVYDHWRERMRSGEIALDALMTQAGLAAFAVDQQAIDDRIADTLGI